MPNRTEPLQAGRKFNRLTIIRYSGTDKYGKRSYICKCDCGNTTEVRGASLTSNNTKSCGCLLKKTGDSKNPLYKTYHSAKYRYPNLQNSYPTFQDFLKKIPKKPHQNCILRIQYPQSNKPQAYWHLPERKK